MSLSTHTIRNMEQSTQHIQYKTYYKPIPNNYKNKILSFAWHAPSRLVYREVKAMEPCVWMKERKPRESLKDGYARQPFQCFQSETYSSIFSTIAHHCWTTRHYKTSHITIHKTGCNNMRRSDTTQPMTQPPHLYSYYNHSHLY